MQFLTDGGLAKCKLAATQLGYRIRSKFRDCRILTVRTVKTFFIQKIILFFRLLISLNILEFVSLWTWVISEQTERQTNKWAREHNTVTLKEGKQYYACRQYNKHFHGRHLCLILFHIPVKICGILPDSIPAEFLPLSGYTASKHQSAHPPAPKSANRLIQLAGNRPNCLSRLIDRVEL